MGTQLLANPESGASSGSTYWYEKSAETARRPLRLAGAPGAEGDLGVGSPAPGPHMYVCTYAKPKTQRGFPLGLELGVAALRRRRTRRLHYSMSSWQ